MLRAITPSPSRPLPSRQMRAIQRFIAEPYIVSRPSQRQRAVHRSIAKPFFASCPSQAVHRCIVKLSSSITSCSSLYRQAVQCSIAEPSIAKPSIAEPSSPLSPSRPLRAVHRDIAEPSIATLPSRPASRPSLHCQAVFCELSIASRPSLHCQAVIVHH